MKSKEGGYSRRTFLKNAAAASAAAALPAFSRSSHAEEVVRKISDEEIKERMALLGSRGKGQSRYHLVRHVLEGKSPDSFVVNEDLLRKLVEEWQRVYESPSHQKNIAERVAELKNLTTGTPGSSVSMWQQGVEAFASAGLPPEYVFLSYVESGMTKKSEPNSAGAVGYFQFTLKSGKLFQLIDTDTNGTIVRDDRTDFAKSAVAAAHHLASDAKLAVTRGAARTDALRLAVHKFNGTFSGTATSYAGFLSAMHKRIQSQVQRNRVQVLLDRDSRPALPAARAEYLVANGDTLPKILRSLGLATAQLEDLIIENPTRAEDLRAGRVYAGTILVVPVHAAAHKPLLQRAQAQRAKREREQYLTDILKMTEVDPREDYWQNIDYGAKMEGLLAALANPQHLGHGLFQEVQQVARSKSGMK
jgi:hypothetical protein